ncbi:MAG: radical SAM protein [bacterium]
MTNNTKPKKVLFIQPPHHFDSGSRTPDCFPLGLCYVATVTKKAGHKVEVLDIWLNDYNKEEVVEIIKKLPHYDVFGVSALSTQYDYIKFLANELKKHFPKTPIVLGNALATHSYEPVLKNTMVDICVKGDGEQTFLELLDNDFTGLDNIKGISYKNGTSVVNTTNRDYKEHLDTIPFPDWDIFDIEKYLKNIHLFGDERFSALNVITGRGCPYDCNFCSKNYDNFRFRSIDNIKQEIGIIKDRFKVKGISFSDELVVFNKARAISVSKMMKDFRLLWDCQARVNTVDKKILKIMRDSGCLAVGYGIESGSKKILDNMNKRINVEQSIIAVRDTLDVGLRPIMQVMFGYPGEDDSTLNETVEFFKKIPHYAEYKFSVTTPLPGSSLYRDCLKSGQIKDEDSYITSLAQGYFYRAEPLVNFTNFKKEFMNKKRAAEELVNKNYADIIKGRKFLSLKRKIRSKFVQLRAYVWAFGWGYAIKRFGTYLSNKLRKHA